MPEIKAVSKTRHANKRWKRSTSYSFAASDAIAPLVLQELPKACMAMPVAFVKKDDAFMPAAVQGFQPGENLFVDAGGRWLGSYVPAAYRAYPFALANTKEGEKVLCIVEDSDSLSDTEGEPFFDDEGKPAKVVQGVLDFLTEVTNNRQRTQQLCAVLQKHDLIQPWQIKLKSDAGDKTIQGLHRVDEAALNQLPAEAFQELRVAGVLPMVYCQLLSMQHVPKLGYLAKARLAPQSTLPKTPEGDLDLCFLNDGDTISFGNLN